MNNKLIAGALGLLIFGLAQSATAQETPASPFVITSPQQPIVIQAQPQIVLRQQPIVIQTQPVIVQQQPIVVQQQPAATPEAAAPQVQLPSPPPEPVQIVPTPRAAHVQPSHSLSMGSHDEARPHLRQRAIGLGFRAGLLSFSEEEEHYWSAGGTLRLIPFHRFGLEASVDFSGTEEELLTPISFSNLFFFNTRGRLQPYLVGGLMISVRHSLEEEDERFTSVGGQMGVGLEMMLGHRLGLTIDLRGFGLAPVNDENVRDDEGYLDFDNMSYGVMLNTGINFYLSRSHNRSCRARTTCFMSRHRGMR